jgi:hypothetical protein
MDAVPASLLTKNPKTDKSEEHGVLTAIQHLAPGKQSGANVCPFATPGCLSACLNTAGHGGIALDAEGLNPVQRARIRRTRFMRQRIAFWAMLERDIRAHLRRCERLGLEPAIRLNGTSDVAWERRRALVGGVWHQNVMRAWPGIQFYDYTKSRPSLRGERGTRKLPPNYHLTYSLSEHEDSEAYALEALALGWNVAVVFGVRKGKRLPSRFWGVPVIDGDAHDVRFLDPRGVIVGLRAKGRALHDESGFVRWVVVLEDEEWVLWKRKSRRGRLRRRLPRRSAGRTVGSSGSRCDLGAKRSASRSSRAGRSSSRCLRA